MRSMNGWACITRTQGNAPLYKVSYMKISIIIPVLNEAAVIENCLEKLTELRQDCEIIIADGGSRDDTLKIVKQFQVQNPERMTVLEGLKPGRAFQMNAGADAAEGDVLLFLHADCELGDGALPALTKCLQNSAIIGGGFYKRYSNENIFLKLYRIVMNVIRTQWLKNLVGTNAIFIRKNVFFQLGKFPTVPLLEDVMLSDRMKKKGKPVFLKPHVIVSSRRYDEGGIFTRIWIALRIMFLFRVMHRSPEKLKNLYQPTR